MKLVIVESPAKAKTISKYLGKEFTVRASVGHIRDLPKSSKKAIDIEKGFQPHYEINPDKKKIISELKKLSDKADEVIIATDPDREGEAIAWHIAQVLKLKNPKRAVFHEITPEAIKKALADPSKINQNLKTAQEARRVLDRLFGYRLSGLIWQKVRYGLSAGRVQSPALRIIMEKEREIREFISEKFWVISAEVKSAGNENFQMIYSKEPKEKDEVDRILKIARENSWKVVDVEEKQAKRRPLPPFITSTLQQTASSRLGFSPSKTMVLAQRLYEAGHITYMRTDSVNLSQNALSQAEKVILDTFGSQYFQKRVFQSKSKNAQEAHEAIRPTNLSTKMAGQDSAQQKLYDLIRTRTVASQMSDAEISRTKISAKPENSDVENFFAKGSRILFDGWMKLDSKAKKEDDLMPKVSIGEPLNLMEITSEEKETQPPKRYSEAGLVKELEKRGIGRPSTYASIIKTIQDRGYVEKIDGALQPTDTGDVVSSFVEKNFQDYISDNFTAEMEDKLDEIADGKRAYENTLQEFYNPFIKNIKAKENDQKITNLGEADPKFKCPECGGSMVIKLGKSGKFLSCSRFPDCEGALTIEGEKIEKPKATGEKCPECGGDLLEKQGRFGKFTACSNYPKCKYIKKDPSQEEKAKTGVKCPKCSDGEMMEKRGRFGIFYACSNYPKCRHAIKTKPTGKICQYKREDKGGQICGELMMEGTKTIPDRCSDKNCPNHNPHKLGK